MPPLTRRAPLGTVELLPVDQLTRVLYGDITVAKVVRPGDMGPVLTVYYLAIAPEAWAHVQPQAVTDLARRMQVEREELRKAVDELCSERS